MRIFYLKLFLSIALISNCEYYNAYKHNEQGIIELNEAKLEDSKTSFHKSISYTYKSEIPIYNIGNALLIEDDLPAAHEKFQQAIEINPDFKEALYNDGHSLYLWGKKELNPDTCNVQRARVLWEQAILRFVETSALPNVGDYKKHSIQNAKFLEEEIAKLSELEKNNCKKEKPEDKKDESPDKEDSPEDKKSDQDDSGKDEKDSKDKDKSGKDEKDSKDKDKSGKDEKDSKDKDNSSKDGKDSKDKDKSGKDGKDSKDKDKSGKDEKDSKDKDKSGNDGKDSKDKDKSGKDGKDSEQGNESNEDSNDQSGNNGHLPADEGGPRKSTLTPDEKQRIQSEMDRIKERSGENKSHRRSRHQQEKTNKTTNELEKGLKEALW